MPIKTTSIQAVWLLFMTMFLVGCQAAPAVHSAETVTLTPKPLPSRTKINKITLTPTPRKPTAARPTRQVARTARPARRPAETATKVQVFVPAGQAIVPILLYHHVSDQGATRYITNLSAFRMQMEILKQEGYAAITISQLAEIIRKGGNLPPKPVAITFDDGYEDTYQNAFPILKEMGFSATVYIITSTLGTKQSYGYLQAVELKEMAAAGWEIGSHSVTHTSLLQTRLGLGNELKQSKEVLEEKVGVKIRSFSYPYGIANEWIKERVDENGYESAVGLDNLITHPQKQLYYLNRREVYRSLSKAGFLQLLEPGEGDHFLATQSALTQTPMP